ncbi:MAG: UDP-N-acetylmuramoyl-L-alanine--D-glutamate ligase [Coriobacteriia bacterium]|nr:UDP-N-acetylmuramoyl-L-alanine--D-glutamate ligase [Coriobacteriia bacterium]MBN2822598.1 UDP-N-acetylmuramoyl-L-alanine--D-glutamate ligase [Coriobacteriia bacterium]
MSAITGHVLVLGLGRSGMAVAERLASDAASGIDVRVSAVDAKEGPGLAQRAEALHACGVDVRLGTVELPDDVDLIVVSPGIPPRSPLMLTAVALGVPILSEVEFAYRLAVSPFVAITGTNGKTTVTSLVAHLLRESGVPCEAVGNIGSPATGLVAEVGPATVLVTEVSSFQLAYTHDFHPRVSVLLNITPDHIDWHGSLEVYSSDKAKVFANQQAGDTAVIDIDDEGAAPYANLVEAQGVRVRRVSKTLRLPYGATVVDGMLCLDDGDALVELVSTDDLLIRGEHNVSNALAAAAAALAAGASLEGVRAGLRTFRPVAHRLEPVGDIGGVEFFNDSKATNPDAVFKALTSFTDRGVVVLLGGRNKGNDFRPLAEKVRERCRAVVVFGESAADIASAFGDEEFVIVRTVDLLQATRAAFELAHPGDVVLLSPACASFDQFDDYEQRGDRFREIVASMGQGGE